MHCILNYPTKDENANLLMIKSLKKILVIILLGCQITQVQIEI